MAVELPWPILGVIVPCILIAVGGYGTHYFILVPHHDSWKQLAWFQFSLAMVWISYALAIFVPPGSPPANFEYKRNEWKRWCIKCDAYKPERTHHCRQCKRCVLKMDHHCPWTFNCVGHNNQPHFIRFILWVNVSCLYALYHLFSRAVALYQSRHLPAYLVPKREIIATVVLIPVVGFVLLTVGVLTIRVFVNIFNGQTQIETWEQERIDSLVRRGLVSHVEFPYDIDPWTNLVNSWGPIYTWVLPWGGPPANAGWHFEKNEVGDDPNLVWPPDHRDQSRPTEEERRQSQEVPRTLGYQTSATSSAAHRHLTMLSHYNNRRQNTESDFYKTSEWQNYEGERISDFGVDIETVATPPPFQTRRAGDHDHSHHDHDHDENEDGDEEDENVPLARLVRH